jgi:hypothetical protein
MTQEQKPFCYTIHCFYPHKNEQGIVNITVTDTLLFCEDKEKILLDCYRLACEYFQHHIEEMTGYSVVLRPREYNGFPGAEIVKEDDEGYKVAWIVVPEEPRRK